MKDNQIWHLKLLGSGTSLPGISAYAGKVSVINMRFPRTAREPGCQRLSAKGQPIWTLAESAEPSQPAADGWHAPAGVLFKVRKLSDGGLLDHLSWA